jgi:hypothetical protein
LEASNTGFFDWLVTGPQTARARVRVTSVADPSLSAGSRDDFEIR